MQLETLLYCSSPHIVFPLFVDSPNEMPFDVVFLLRLRYVKKKGTLAQLVKLQHDGLDETPAAYIESVLKGKTNHRVLLMLDGYDEYTPGTNKDIDKAIESTIGNCFLIVTSRPGYLKKYTRNKMDGEVIIEGFSSKNILLCGTKYLGSLEKSLEMLKEATKTGIDALLHVPIILVMTVVVYLENETLPKTKTGIYNIIYGLATGRTTLKTFGCKSSEIPQLEDLLHTLGELSWTALQKDIQQLLLSKVGQT